MNTVAHRSRRLGGSMLAAALALALIGGTAGARAASPNPGPPPIGGPASNAPIPPPEASFTWAVPNRYGAKPSHEYLYPRWWPVDFSACSSGAKAEDVTGYEWQFGDGARWSARSCGPVRHRYDALGTYDVTLTIRMRDGSTASAGGLVEVRDLLVVALGDSFSAGEGNPDVDATSSTLPRWQNGACHRSLRSGAALAALELERRDPHTSVTFVTLACSGATIANGLLGAYDGWDAICPVPEWVRVAGGSHASRLVDRCIDDPVRWPENLDPANFQPQVTALRDLVCADDCSAPGVRRVDILMLSIGVNDVGFSDIVEACAGPVSDYCGRTQMGRFLDGLHALADPDPHDAGYHGLASALAASGVQVGDTYVTEYPYDVFTKIAEGKAEPETCGPFFRIGDDEVDWLSVRGKQLDDLLHRAAIQNDWHYVHGVADAFRPHGYCADVPWFVKMSESLDREAHYAGVLHPNAAGHARIASLILAEIDDHTLIDERWAGRVTFDAISIDNPSGPNRSFTGGVTFGVTAER
jgi:hypothetical protein